MQSIFHIRLTKLALLTFGILLIISVFVILSITQINTANAQGTFTCAWNTGDAQCYTINSCDAGFTSFLYLQPVGTTCTGLNQTKCENTASGGPYACIAGTTIQPSVSGSFCQRCSRLPALIAENTWVTWYDNNSVSGSGGACSNTFYNGRIEYPQSTNYCPACSIIGEQFCSGGNVHEYTGNDAPTCTNTSVTTCSYGCTENTANKTATCDPAPTCSNTNNAFCKNGDVYRYTGTDAPTCTADTLAQSCSYGCTSGVCDGAPPPPPPPPPPTPCSNTNNTFCNGADVHRYTGADAPTCIADTYVQTCSSGCTSGACNPNNPGIVSGFNIPGGIVNPIGLNSVRELIDGVAGFIFWISSSLLTLIILYGAFILLTSGGNVERVKTGKKVIYWALIGFVVAVLATGIASIIENIIFP